MATSFQNPSSTGLTNPMYGGQFSSAGTGFNKTLLQAAQANRYSADPVYRKVFYEKIYRKFGFGDWLEENMGWKTFCHKTYSLAHFYPDKNWIELGNVATISVGASGGTASLVWPSTGNYVSNSYILPTIGSWLMLPPLGQMVRVSNITKSGSVFTVVVTNDYNTAFTIPVGATVKVFASQEIADCVCPTGFLRLEEGPVKEDYQMINLVTPSDEICGDALLECQNLLFKWTYTDDQGCVQTAEYFYDAVYQKMLNDHRMDKMARLVNDPRFGIIPKVRKYGIKWNWATSSELVLADLTNFSEFITDNSIDCDTFAFHLGHTAFMSAQKLCNDEGQGKVTYGCYDPTDSCKTLSLEWCAIKWAGITFTFHLERGFSDKNFLGGGGFLFKNRGIGVPMCNRTKDCGDNDEKMFTTVYFESQQGQVFNDVIDSNGYMNGPNGRNTYGLLCKKHVYGIESDFVGEVHNPEMWVAVNEI